VSSPAQQQVSSSLRFTDLTAGDTVTVRTVFEGLSMRSRFLRFHAGRAMLPLRMQQRLADVRPGFHQAHVALLDHRPVGIVRWIRYAEEPQSAELAIEVIDAVQDAGIGRQLAARAARSAMAAGVQCFLAFIDESNPDLRVRTLSYGATIDRHDRGLLRLPVQALLAAVGGSSDRHLQRCP
jgi:L-amino acid N-acyltransferase YncA